MCKAWVLPLLLGFLILSGVSGIYVSAEPELETVFNRTYGGALSDTACFAAETSDEGFLILGQTTSYGAGDWDIWLIKIDQNGEPLWNKTYGTPVLENGYYIILTTDGGYLIAGRTNYLRGSDVDLLLIKIDRDGNLLWNRTYGGSGDEWMWEIEETSDGGYALAGRINSFGFGLNDYWLLKVDENGEPELNVTLGGAEDERARSLLITDDGGYLVLGWSGTYTHGMLDFWLVKTDPSGIIQWNNSYGGQENERGISLENAVDNGYVLAGSSNSFSDEGSVGYFIKVDSMGNMIWNKTYGGEEVQTIHFILPTQSGGYALFSGARIILTDAEGNSLLEKTYGGPDYNSLGFAIKTSDGSYLVGGGTTTSTSGDDVIVLKLREAPPVPEQEPAQIIYKGITVEPEIVETGDEVTITISLENAGDLVGDVKIELYINDKIEFNRLVTVDGKDTKTEAFTLSPEAGGSYTVRAGTVETSLTVTVPEPPEAEQADSGIPGFSIVSILLGLLLVHIRSLFK
jgi:hypothetical protein